MHRTFLTIVFALSVLGTPVSSQSHSWSDTAGYPLIRISAGYGINGGHAESANMEFHQQKNPVDSKGNTIFANQFSARSEVTEPTAEYLVTLSVRPEADIKSLNLRIGHMRNAFRYTTTMPQTQPDGSPGGNIIAMTEERYQVTPVSLGAAISTVKPLFHLYGEVIYAWASMSEEQSYTLSDGTRVRLSSTRFTSSSVGFRAGVGITISFTKKTAVVIDWGYRGLGFYHFIAENEPSIGLDYSTSGTYGMIGLSLGW